MGTGKIIQADNIDGIKVQKNFISNGLATLNTSGWATYKDAAGTRPVDGTGGSPTLVSFTRSTTSPLDGTASFLFSVTGSSSAQGEGASYDFTIDAAYKAKVLKIEADYIVNSGTFVAGSSTTDSDVIVYIYDVTNSTLIEPSSFKFLSNSTTISDKFSATFQTSATGTQYRLIFHVASTSTAAYALKIDNVSVSPSQYVYGTPITDWQSYTPTISSNTGVNVNSAFYRRVGDSEQYRISIGYNNTGGAGNFTASIRPGSTIDATKVVSVTATTNSFGSFLWFDSGVGWKTGSVVSASNQTVAITNDGATSILTNGLFANGDVLTLDFTVPIVGVSSSVQVSDGYEGRVVNFVGYVTAGTALTALVTDIPFGGIDKDSHGAWNGTQYKIPVVGDYQVNFSVAQTAATVSNYYYYVNGVLGKQVGTNPSTSAATAKGSILIPNLKAGDLVSFRTSTSGITTASASDLTTSISLLSGSPTISATETVAARYYSTTAQSVGTASVINFDLKDFDTHGAVTTGASWSFKVPTYGIYEINSSFLTATTTSVQNFFYIIYKDGVSSDKAVAWHIKETTNSSRQFGKGSSLIELKAGESINLRGSASGSSTNLSGDQSMNFIEIKLVK